MKDDLVEERTASDRFENAIREYGVVAACEWFGYKREDDFTVETIAHLESRLAEDHGRKAAANPTSRGERS